MGSQSAATPKFTRRKSDRWFPKFWSPELLSSNIDTRIAGTRIEYIFQEFINNSAHFPIALLTLEFLIPLHEGLPYLVHFFVLLAGGISQAVFLGNAEFNQHPRPFLGNLVAPMFCFFFLVFESQQQSIFHLEMFPIFLGYSLLIGGSQEIRFRVPVTRIKHLAILFENILRVGVLLVLIWKAHELSHSGTAILGDFLSKPYHLYLIVVFPMFGILVGMANINAYRYMTILRQTAIELKKYSEWLLGPDLLKRTVHNPTALNLHTADRTVVFMDIRGFTQWSVNTDPQGVVTLINNYFQATEDVLKDTDAIKVELTGDEILAVFYSPATAVWMAMEIMKTVKILLAKENLRVGIGINTGPVIEGLVGGRNLKKYSVMGDTVNTGKRICDVAGPDEILISESTLNSLEGQIVVGEARRKVLKGKKKLLNIYPLLDLREFETWGTEFAAPSNLKLSAVVPQE